MLKDFIHDNRFDLPALFTRHDSRPALTGKGWQVTYGEYAARILSVAEHLRRLCNPDGKLVGLYMPDSQLSPVLMLASWLNGARYVPLDARAPLDTLLEVVTPDLLVTDQPAAAGRVQQVVSPDHLSGDTSVPETETGCLTSLDLDAEASVILTSGSSGAPKGVVHTIGNYVYSAWGTNEYLSLKPEDAWLISLPLFHVGGLLIFVRTLLSGAAACFPDTGESTADALQRYRPAFFSLVPTQLMRYLEDPELATVMQESRGLLLGGAAAPDWLVRKAYRSGIPVLPTYGSTESCAQATGVDMDAGEDERCTSGRPLRFRTVRLDTDRSIIIGGQTVFKRYLHESGSTPPGAREFKTSDIGCFDSAGNLVVQGRSDQVFQSGGENINPAEIESALKQISSVREAVVVPVPHPEFGRVPWAFVETTLPADPDKLREPLRRTLSAYKIPKRILPLPEGSGHGMKPRRKELAELAAHILENS